MNAPVDTKATAVARALMILAVVAWFGAVPNA